VFEKASRLKLRFDTARGLVSADDLWDLPLLGSGASLDNIARSISREIKENEEESFVVQNVRGDGIDVLALGIVKHVIKIRLEEASAKEKEVEVKVKKERIMAILADKQDDALKGKSEDELKTLLDGLV
jgi:hypothetical protein